VSARRGLSPAKRAVIVATVILGPLIELGLVWAFMDLPRGLGLGLLAAIVAVTVFTAPWVIWAKPRADQERADSVYPRRAPGLPTEGRTIPVRPCPCCAGNTHGWVRA
jgi:type VI protein secretion system component VasK